jgi:epidermal growth factor receptor substrate 15
VSNCSYLSDKSDVSPENASFKLNESSQSIEGKKEKLKSTIFHSQVVEDDIEKAKQEKKTFQVTNSELSAENFKLKQEKEEILTENLNLKQEKERLLEELEKNSAQVQDFKTVLEKQIKLLHEEIKVKDEDYENLKDQLKKSEFNRKKFAEALKDAEAELNLSKKKNSQLLNSFEALERKNKENLEIIHEEKQKVYIIDELKQEIEQLKYEMILLKDQNFVLKNESLIAKESLETVRKNFDNLRICSRDKETEFQRVIEDMMEQVNSEKARTALQAAETAKLKKTLTWKDSDTFNNFSREEISRFQQKIIQLDKENGDLVSEIEKLQKNIDYFKFLIKNKEEVLQKLESENLSLKSSNESILLSYSQESLQNLLKSLNSWMTCQKCKESISVYLISPCFHLVCSKCEPVSSICPACEGFLTHQSLFSDFNKLREVISLLQSLQVSL